MARVLLVLSSLLLVVGGWTHTGAYHKAVEAVAGSDLPAYFGNALKALWLMDSSGMFMLAAICMVIATRLGAASGVVVLLLAVIPAATAVLLYLFIGRFLGAHILLATAVLMAAAGAQLPWRGGSGVAITATAR